ncbi:MAG: topoisomerase [Thermomicrobiales bacterium]|nr:topoisomerase [Thermomicrobiales bacterium]
MSHLAAAVQVRSSLGASRESVRQTPAKQEEPTRVSRSHEPPDPCLVVDPSDAARAVGLRYVSDSGPGIRRKRVGKHFSYLDTNGEPIRDARELQRIKALGIPPAWTEVWICPSPKGHIQATGRDAKGRKQYRYHPRWRAVRDETKYGRLRAFGEALPRLRQRLEEDLALPGLPREKVLATVVRLLETTLIRVGNEEYARHNDSYGLTTMRDDHVDVAGSTVQFSFRGKSGKEHTIGVRDRRLAAIVKRCRDLPGQELFQYQGEDDQPRTIGSADVNGYLREVMGQEFTAKDFRTWAGSVLAAQELLRCGPTESETAARRNVVAAIQSVSSRLGNTPAICRRCYVHPVVIDAYQNGVLAELAVATQPSQSTDLPPEEQFILHLLDQSADP